MTERDLTCYCGLYCGDCIRYESKASELAAGLLKEFEATQFGEYARVKTSQIPDFRYYETLINLLTHVARLRCEVPCRLGGDGCEGACPIVACVKDKSFDGCWECSEYESCEKLECLKSFHGDTPLYNLRMIKKFGITAWVTYRGKCYPWLKERAT